MTVTQPSSTLFPYTTLFRSGRHLRYPRERQEDSPSGLWRTLGKRVGLTPSRVRIPHPPPARSEEHTSELQSRGHLVCRLLLEKKNDPQSRGQAVKHERRFRV